MTPSVISFDEILDWYSNFSLAPPRDFSIPNANQFWRVSNEKLEECERETKVKIPAEIKAFLTRVGEGHFSMGMNGIFVDTYANEFLGPSSIADILMKRSDAWLVYEEFIFPNEFPFFNLGSNSVLVLRNCEKAYNKVYFPGDPVAVSESFEQFILDLKNDAQFYVKQLRSDRPV